MARQNDQRKEANEKSGNNYSRKEFQYAYHSVKTSGGDVNSTGALEKAANDNRNYLKMPNEIPKSGGYTGYANQESDF